jgi:hypothetical protein
MVSVRLIEGVRPNSTPHTDARMAAVLEQTSLARAGERER